MRIALADGDAEARTDYVKVLARLGHEALAAPTGRRLVGLCRAASPELVIADVFMPDGTGVEAARELSKHRECRSSSSRGATRPSCSARTSSTT